MQNCSLILGLIANWYKYITDIYIYIIHNRRIKCTESDGLIMIKVWPNFAHKILLGTAACNPENVFRHGNNNPVIVIIIITLLRNETRKT